MASGWGACIPPVLRAVENAGFEEVGSGLRRRWVFRTGQLEGDRKLSRRAVRQLLDASEHRPVAVLQDDARTWWLSSRQVFVEREGLTADDVAALLAERADRAARRLERAHAVRTRAATADSPASPPGRRHVPREVRLAVWQRDGGRCTSCGSEFDLQYDHVIPVALGGGTSEANLQLLCGACNQRKGASIA